MGSRRVFTKASKKQRKIGLTRRVHHLGVATDRTRRGYARRSPLRCSAKAVRSFEHGVEGGAATSTEVVSIALIATELVIDALKLPWSMTKPAV